MATRKAAKAQTIGKTPQGQTVSETPITRNVGLPHEPLDAYGHWLGDPEARYGKLRSSQDIPIAVKLEMLRDPVIAWCQEFLSSTLVKATRVIECADEEKRRFFEAMFRAFESEFILQASMAIAMGGVGLIKKYAFAVPQPVALDAPPVWTSTAVPFICRGFDQIHPYGTSPEFKDKKFDGIETTDGHIDRFYSLWITLGQARAFGSYLGSGRLDNCYYNWWLGHFSGDNFAVYEQKLADPVVQVGFPPGTSEGGKSHQDIALLIGDQVRSGATVALPSDVYTVVDPTTAEEKPTAVRKWTMEFTGGPKNAVEFIQVDDHENAMKALGYLVAPQAFLQVGGGDLGGPTTADVLTEISSDQLLIEAADIDRHLNDYVFRTVDVANFPSGSPPVRVRTTGISKASQVRIFELVKLMMGRPDVQVSVFNLIDALKQLNMPIAEGRPVTVQPPATPEKKPTQENQPPQAQNGNPPSQEGGQGAGVGAGGVGLASSSPKGAAPDPAAPITDKRVIHDAAHADLGDERDDDKLAEISQKDIQVAMRRMREVWPEAFAGLPAVEASHFDHVGVPGGGPGGSALAPGDLKDAAINKLASSVVWNNDHEIDAELLIELPEGLDGKQVSKDDALAFISQRLPKAGLAGLGATKDIDSVEVLRIEGGHQWMMVKAKITPSVEAGKRWAKDNEAGDQSA